MALFGLIDTNSRICQLASEVFPVAAPLTWTPDISSVSPAPQVGWAATLNDGAWAFTAPSAPTAAQQAQAALGAGIVITSTGTPALNATYPTSGPIWEDLKDEAVFIASFAGFSSGASSMAFLLPSGPTITFTATSQLQAVVKAAAMYISALKAIIVANPGSGSLPAATATIA